ncbi:sugar kinase [Halobacteriales archaeon QS_1_68_17]|nr:MAG: sugar kinase [Halobacteriales archaeon QS_1_68_17]
MSRVICAGHVNWDVTVGVEALPDPDGEVPVERSRKGGGGSAANVATALVDLGVDAALAGSVGDDPEGRRTRRELRAAGVDVTGVRTVADRATTVKYLVVDAAGRVMVLGDSGANEAYDGDAVADDALAAADRLHLTGQDPETAASLAARAADHGLAVSFDPGRRLDDRDYSATLDRADLLFLNEREARAAIRDNLGPVDDLDTTVVIKQGRDGAELFTPAGGYLRGSGFAVDPVDTTGAGDAFAAGFLAALDRGEADLERALAVANACGALASETLGARARLDRSAVASLVEGERI